MASFCFDPAAAPAEELRRIAHAQVDSALEELDSEDRHRAVHRVRQRGKKVRALLRLVRPAAPALYAQENAAFRDMMRPLSDARDRGVAVETYDALIGWLGDDGAAERLAPVRTALQERRDAVLGEDLDARLEALRAGLHAARGRVDGWEVDADGFAAFAGGLAKTYRRARVRMEDAYADPTPARFHVWRKRAKYHRHHLELLEAAWPSVLAVQREQVHHLTDLLGDDHDLAVLRADLTAAPGAFAGEDAVAEFCDLLDRRRAELQDEARVLGTRCFAEEPDAIVARLRTCWDAARADADAGRR